MNRIQLSNNFYLDEFTRSSTAARHAIRIDVEPDSEVFHNIRRLCRDVLQPLRDQLGSVHITSGYRPPEVNRLVGGSNRSMHRLGLAADIVVTGHTPYEVCSWLANSRLQFDQCIHEFGRWTHIGIVEAEQIPRRQLLTAIKQPAQAAGQRAKTVYSYGIHPVEEGL